MVLDGMHADAAAAGNVLVRINSRTPDGTRANVETIIYPASACPDVLRLSVAKLAAGVLFAAWEVAEWPVSHGNVTVWEEPRISAYIAPRVVAIPCG
jgi:hypothetical protein